MNLMNMEYPIFKKNNVINDFHYFKKIKLKDFNDLKYDIFKRKFSCTLQYLFRY
jgi:hypothetical protein